MTIKELVGEDSNYGCTGLDQIATALSDFHVDLYITDTL